jgi:hypothetical protein
MKLLKITLLIVLMSLAWAKTNYKNPYLDSFATKFDVQEYNLGSLKNKLKGNVLLSITWQDKLGKNIFVLTKTKEMPIKDNLGNLYRNQYIFAYHFLEKNGKLKRIRRLIDFEKECEFDLYVDFVKHALSITDINQDGIAEITMVYQKDCASDVGPSSMKVIMLHNNKKYALRGVADLKPDIKKSIDCYWCNKYKIDPAFKKAPKSFLIFAKERWKMFRY